MKTSTPRCPTALLPLLLVIATLLATMAPVAATEPATPTQAQPLEKAEAHPRIINGRVTGQFPSTVALIDETGLMACTGTLIGCETVLTAAHCVCLGVGTECQAGGSELVNADDLQIFAQHAGFVGVDTIHVPSTYEFGVTDDVAILKLSTPVTGIEPTPINETASPGIGSLGTIVGFGADEEDFGLKRTGKVELATCTAVPGAPHLCWNFEAPLGPVGEDSNTCQGDSGGPLFMNLGDGQVVAGVTSGGTSAGCLPSDRSWDANVFFNRAWIRSTAGGDIDNRTCGGLPAAGGPEAPIFAENDTVSVLEPEQTYTVDVPEGVAALRFTVNGHEGNALNDYDLHVRYNEAATTDDFDCRSITSGVYESCEITNPRSGTWHVLVSRFTGGGRFQTTATVFGATLGGCSPSNSVLCIDDAPGDRRFELTVDYETVSGGGQAGAGQAIALASLGIRRGGLFWFFAENNPELLIKVLNGCAINGNYWVFWSAGTTVGLDVTVRDTFTGATKTYLSEDGQPAQPVTDLEAFSCNS